MHQVLVQAAGVATTTCLISYVNINDHSPILAPQLPSLQGEFMLKTITPCRLACHYSGIRVGLMTCCIAFNTNVMSDEVTNTKIADDLERLGYSLEVVRTPATKVVVIPKSSQEIKPITTIPAHVSLPPIPPVQTEAHSSEKSTTETSAEAPAPRKVASHDDPAAISQDLEKMGFSRASNP